jgi:bifunctional UDP-N-acetylglucosamine pyrophosphorylase/glucosamine-1-phosphate N-acetyltransferase
MNSGFHKSAHTACSLPLPVWTLRAVLPLCEEPPVVILREGCGEPLLKSLEGSRIAFHKGGGSLAALESALRLAEGASGYVPVLRGDMPLLRTETLEALAGSSKGNAAAVLVSRSENPEGYGRVVRGQDGKVIKIAGKDDACDITEIDCGAYCFDCGALSGLLDKTRNREISGVAELIGYLAAEGRGIASLALRDPNEAVTVKDRITLAFSEQMLRGRINYEHMKNGVTFIDPERAYIDPDVTIGRDTVIWPDVVLRLDTKIAERVTLYPGCRLMKTHVGNDCVLQAVVSNEAVIGDGVTVGPFVNIRPGTRISNGCKIGDFVEIKNSNIGEGSKVPHLSYVWDGDMGARVNIGCGTVFSNYDGFKKQRTVIGDDAFIGCNTNLVAPVKVGNKAYTAAGSTITEDVPDNSMAVARARQVNKEGYMEKYRQKQQQ